MHQSVGCTYPDVVVAVHSDTSGNELAAESLSIPEVQDVCSRVIAAEQSVLCRYPVVTTEVIKDGDTIVERNILRWRGFSKVADGSIGKIDIAAGIEDIVALVSSYYFFNISSAEEVGWEMIFSKLPVLLLYRHSPLGPPSHALPLGMNKMAVMRLPMILELFSV